LLGVNSNLTNKNNIFVKGLDENIKSDELEEKFKEFGEVKSAKVSINPDYTSRKYGFVCFQNAESAEKAIKAQRLGDQNLEILPY
jgi:polyadenylate-binding protein